MKVSVLITTHRRAAFLREALASTLEQDWPDIEVVVVANPPDEETEALLREEFPSVKVVRTHRNIGAFPAMNLAVANSTGQLLMLVDDDARFLHRDCIRTLARALRDDPRLAAATANIEGPREAPLATRDHYVEVFKNGFTLFRREVFTRIAGPYPDVFFRSAGESFLAERIWDRGLRIKRVAGARMFHNLTMTGRVDRDWKFHGLRSQLLCTLMHAPWWLVPPLLASKAAKSFVLFIRWGFPLLWWQAMASTIGHVEHAVVHRRPIKFSTWRLLRRLARETVTALPGDDDRPG